MKFNTTNENGAEMDKPIDTGIQDKVRSYRSTVIIGDCIDMIPYSSEHDPDVVRLRNLEEVRYFMNLPDASSVSTQA